MTHLSTSSAMAEMERQSADIQRELAQERRARSVSPSLRGLTTSLAAALPPRPVRALTPARLQTQPASSTAAYSLDSSRMSYHMENADKMIVGQELKTLRGALLATRRQLEEAEKDAQGFRQKAEEVRSELMQLETEKAAASEELQKLLGAVEHQRGTSHQAYSAETQHASLRNLGISGEEAQSLYENNLELRRRQRNMDLLQLERDELSRQLDIAKDDLLRDQKQCRLQREEMSEEMEALSAHLEETQNGWAITQQQLESLEVTVRRLQQEKDQLIQERSNEYDDYQAMASQESEETHQMMSREVEDLAKELHQLQAKITDLQNDNKFKDESNVQLREETMALRQQLTQEQSARAAVTEEHRKTLQTLRKETDSAMLQLRESLFLDKQRTVEELRAELEQARRSNAFKTEERMTHLMAENAQLLSEKNQEIADLQEKLRGLQESLKTSDRRWQEKIDQQVREAVARQRDTLDKETQWKMQNERQALALDTKQRLNEMQMTIDREKEANHRLTREVTQLKEELEEQRRVSREAAKERQLAVAMARDQIREESNCELNKVREKVKQDMAREVERLQSQLTSRDEEIRNLKADNQKLVSRERDHLSSLDRVEKTVISEINEECRRSASLLDLSPRQVPFSSGADPVSSRAQITAALANLRAMNEELRKHSQALTQELHSCRADISRLEKEKKDCLQTLRKEMEEKKTQELEMLKEKKTQELEMLKEKLTLEHSEELAKVAQTSARQSLANSMVGALRRKDNEIEDLKQTIASWREQTAEKYARIYHSDLAQELAKSQNLLQQSAQEQKRINDMHEREISRLEKEVHRLSMMQSNRGNLVSPTPQQQQQQYLQARIKQLHSENNALRRKHLLSKNNLSAPDLSSADLTLLQSSPRRCVSPVSESKLRQLEQRLRMGEKEALKAEERARLKQSIMAQKLAEMANLQDTLADQNQELLRLEHAFSQLHHQYNQSPVQSVAQHLKHSR